MDLQTMINKTNRILPYDLLAVGDLHGRIDLLTELVEGLRDTQVELLFLGDVIDRAKNPGDDLKILDTIKNLREHPEEYGLSSVECLMGNHEDMFVQATRVIDGSGFQGMREFDLWERNGGDGGKIREMAHHAEWVRDLPLYLLRDRTLFVHAGVFPNVPLQDQEKEDLVWIRDEFLNAEYINVPGVSRVIHGHTPNFFGFPVVTHDRICLDTGAFATGALTVYNNRSGELFQITGEPR